MPLSKKINKYPPEYLELAGAFETNSEPRIFAFSSRKEAEAARFKLYGFKSALEAERLENPYVKFLATEIVLAGESLIIRMPEDNPMVQAIRSQLQAPGRAPAQSGSITLESTVEPERSAAEDVTLRFLKTGGTFRACDQYSGLEPADCETCSRPFAEHE